MDEKELTPVEAFYVRVMRKNAKEKVRQVVKRWRFLGLDFKYEWRSKHNGWGRFGGGWQIEAGFQWSGRTLILNFFVFSIRISKPRREE